MGKNKGGGHDKRAREKVDHRGGARGKGYFDEGADFDAEKGAASGDVPQELIDKAALLGCEVWQIDEYE